MLGELAQHDVGDGLAVASAGLGEGALEASRDLRVLDAAVELVDEMCPARRYPEGNDIAARAGLDVQSVGAALNALEGEFLEIQRTGDFGRWAFPGSTPAVGAAGPAPRRRHRTRLLPSVMVTL